MAREVLLTQSGYEALVNELEYLKTEKRAELAEKIKVARGFGDLSENAEYEAALLFLTRTETRMQALRQLLEQAVLSPASASLAEREAAFPALAALPMDTDSFLAVGRLGELVAMAGGADAALP
mgnify:CR=1 FL=1